MFESFYQQHILIVERGSITYKSISKDSSFVVVSIGYKPFLLQLQLCKFGLDESIFKSKAAKEKPCRIDEASMEKDEGAEIRR